MNEEKEEGLILYSILIGVILTFVSLIYYQYESLVLWDSLSGESFAAYGFPFGWITSRSLGFLGPLDLAGFLFDVAFWAAITYAILRYIAPGLIKFTQKK